MAKLIVHYDFGWFDSPNTFYRSEFHVGSSDPVHQGISIVLDFQNLTGKTIKYCTFLFKGYNRVGDAVTDMEGNRFTGPLSHGQIHTDGVLHNVFYDSTISAVKLYSVNIDYMDGTSETILTKDGYADLKSISPLISDNIILENVKNRGMTVDTDGDLIQESYYQLGSKAINNSSVSPSSSTTNQSGGCYVATAVYGSYDCPEVWILRRYRDYYLAKTLIGRLFISLYYSTSPTIVKLFGHKKSFSVFFRAILDKKIKKLLNAGYSDNPYYDKKW